MRSRHEPPVHDHSVRGPHAFAIVAGAIDVALGSPAMVAVVFVTGLVAELLPTGLDALVQNVGDAVGVVLAAWGVGYGLDGTTPLFLRVVFVVVASLVGAVAVLLGFLALVLPGVYVAVRLFLATPAVMLGDDGPLEALSTSWRLMGGSVLSALGAAVLVLGAGLLIGLPLLLATESMLLAAAVLAVVVGAPAVGAQVYLYRELSGA